MSVTSNMASWLRKRVDSEAPIDNISEMNDILRKLSQWRSLVLSNTFIQHHGSKILQGPFQGMEYLSVATEGALMPRLLGTYESELHPYIAEIAEGGLDCVIDVGCAEGYYAVGLARMLGNAEVYAFDINDRARVACRNLAELNGVADRVFIGEEFKPDGFQEFSGKNCLVMVDVEGAELEVLQPAKSPALRNMSIIVETHDQFRRGALSELKDRFSATHDIRQVEQSWPTYPVPHWLQKLGHLDQLLSVWEFRSAPTPWLVMRPKV